MALADYPFRVLLDLTDLHINNFKYVWINVAPRELKTISDLKISILQKLNLERGDIKLFVHDGLLLEEETITVLRENDTVKVQYGVQCTLSDTVESPEKETVKKSSRKRSYNTNDISDLPISSKRHKSEECVIINDAVEIDVEKAKSMKKKRKSHSLTEDGKNNCNSENNCSFILNSHNEVKTHKKKKKRKSSMLDHDMEGVSFDNTECSFFSFPFTEIQCSGTSRAALLLKTPPTNCVSEVNKTIDSTNDLLSENTPFSLQNEATNLDDSPNKKSEGSTNNCPKKKRKRRRKRKQATVSNVSNGDNVENTEMTHSMHSSVTNKIPENSLSNDSNLPNNISTDTYVKEKAIETKVQTLNSYPKVSTPSQSKSFDDPSWHVSLMHTSSSVDNSGTSSKKELIKHKKPIIKSLNQTTSMFLKQSTNFFSNSSLENEDDSLLKSVSSSSVSEPAIVVKQVSKDKERSQNCESNKSIHKNPYSDLPGLNSLPKIGTHIAYKTLELDENYSPAVSDYREGIVKNINPDTEEMEIELIKKVIKPGRTGKFENLREDETPLPEVMAYDFVKWSAIVSPKCLS